MLGRTSVRVLHAGSIAAGIGSVATAADLTFFGGTGTAIAVALSGVEVFKTSDEQTRDFAKRFAEALDKEVAASGLKGDRLIHVFQMLEKYRPSDADVAAADKDAGRIVTGILKCIKTDDACGPEHRTPEALDDFGKVITPALGMALEPVTLAEAVETEGLKRQTAQEAKLDRLLAMAEEQGASDRLRAVGITEEAIMGLVRNSSQSTEDLGQAWKELQNLVEIALRVQAEAAAGSNHGDLVDEVLKRSAALSAKGDNKAALAEIEDALKAQEAQALRLLESGAEYALLDGDTKRAADLLVRKADQEAGGRADFEALQGLQYHYYIVGRDKGLNLELRLSIDLARLVLDRASNADDRGAVRNNFGVVLKTLGERESGTERLEEAVAAFQSALEEWTRDRTPLDWAMAQMNLGTALAIIGGRASGTERLEEAVTAFRSALEERTRDRVPLDWAMTQMNLGAALRILGERESGTERLEEAVAAFRSVLEERTRDRAPRDWATTQMNLGNALLTLGQRESGTERLEEAVAAYRSAL